MSRCVEALVGISKREQSTRVIQQRVRVRRVSVAESHTSGRQRRRCLASQVRTWCDVSDGVGWSVGGHILWARPLGVVSVPIGDLRNKSVVFT